MPRLKWLIFQVPISSPHRIRIFGCFVAMIYSFLLVEFVLRLPAAGPEKNASEAQNAPSKCHVTPPCAPPGDARDGTSACTGMPRPSCGATIARFSALNGD